MFKRRKAAKPDFFRDSVKERRAAEDEQPWFLADDDGPDLEVEAGRSGRQPSAPAHERVEERGVVPGGGHHTGDRLGAGEGRRAGVSHSRPRSG